MLALIIFKEIKCNFELIIDIYPGCFIVYCGYFNNLLIMLWTTKSFTNYGCLEFDS